MATRGWKHARPTGTVTVKGSLVSVLAFREMGQGIRPTNFEHVAVSAAKHLAN